MRILHVVAHSQHRGAENVALELARELDERGHTDEVVALEAAFGGTSDPELPPLTGAGNFMGAKLTGRKALPVEVWRLRREIDRVLPDVVLAHGGQAMEVTAFARTGAGPLVVWQRILGFPPDVWRRRSRRQWWRTVSTHAHATVVLTTELRDELRRLKYRGPIWTIPNFRDPERFVKTDRAEEAHHLRDELGIPAREPVVGFVSHLVEQKRPERTLDVLTGVLARGERAHLVVAGDGPLREPLLETVHARGLDQLVHVLGYRSDVEHVLAGLDLMLLTSDDEGIPGVAIEAQMAGCPVVTFPVGGVSAVVEDGSTGVVLDEPDTALMSDRVVELLRDTPRRRRLGDEGRRRAKQFTTAHAAAEYEARLSELLDRRQVLARLGTASPVRRRAAEIREPVHVA